MSLRDLPWWTPLNTVLCFGHIQDQAIPLQDLNVLMLDDVDSPQVRIAGTLLVDAPFPMQLPVAGDPIHTIIEQSAVLSAFVKP